VLCAVAGFFLAEWLAARRDATPLARICARVDYLSGLQQELPGEQAASEEVRNEFKALVEDCRVALRNRADEAD
jgi:hypothetical protein